MSIVNTVLNLVLDKDWKVIGERTIMAALTNLCSSEFLSKDSCDALDIDYALNSDGSINWEVAEFLTPRTWNDWIKLPVRGGVDLPIHTPKMVIRCPLITIAKKHIAVPKKFFKEKPSKEGIWRRDKGICQYSGRVLMKNEATLDHVVARSKHRGNPNTWTNLVLCDKDINFRKGNKSLEEAGLKLLRQPTEPKPQLPDDLITERHPAWRMFLSKK
jgi:hypothetical protein